MKVLILTCSTGEGHNAAARAIAKELGRRGIACETKNALSFTSKSRQNLVEKGHSFMYRYAPELYGAGYEYVEQQKSHYLLYLDYARYSLKLAYYIYNHGFDTAVCVHEFPAFMLTSARRSLKFSLRQYFVATDYSLAPGLEQTDMDGWFVPAGFADALAEKGIPRERIFETGIPVDADCYRPVCKQAARKKLGLRDDIPVLLIGAGSIGCGPIRELAVKLKALSQGQAVIAVLCGRNKELLKELSEQVEDGLLIPITFTAKINDWLAAADVLCPLGKE